MTEKPTLQMESVMGPMPWVAKIYQFSDSETKKNLKLASKGFWREHCKEKFQMNFSEAQESRHRQLYCYGDCPKTDEFESCFQPPLHTTDRGEICEPDQPRTREGWIINHLVIDEETWEKPKKEKQVKKWSGCRRCWEKFCDANPEYKIFK